jgi:hypothetical protein
MVLFKETQGIGRKWLRITLSTTLLGGTAAFGATTGSLISGAGILLFTTGLILTIAAGLVKLEVKSMSDGLHFCFEPFHKRWTVLRWEDINTIYIREYKPFAEFGGRGIRETPVSKAYTVSGNRGIQIILKNGEKILIGTLQPDAWNKVLQELRIQLRKESIF